MSGIWLVALLATNAYSAPRHEVVNNGESVEIITLPESHEPTPLERDGESFFTEAPDVDIRPDWGVAELAQAWVNAVKSSDRTRLLNRLAQTKPRPGADLRWLLNLYGRNDAAVRIAVDTSLGLLTPADADTAPFFEALMADEDPIFQALGLIGAGHVRSPASLKLIHGFAEKPLPFPQPTLSMTPQDANRWHLQVHALTVLADWEGEKTLPLLMKRAQEAPAAAEIAATRFWEAGLPDFISWSESRRKPDQERAAAAWGADVPRASLEKTKGRLWELLLKSKRRETRHRAAIKLGIAASPEDVDRLLAERAKTPPADRPLLDAALFASRHEKAVPVLLEYAKTAKDPLARASALFQLRTMMPPEDYRALLRWVAENDADAENKANARRELAAH